MAEQIAYSITIGGVDREIKTMQDLKKAIKDANNELLQAGPVGSQSYTEAQKKVTELKDKLGDLGDAAKVQGTAIEKMGASTGLLGEGFKNLDLDKIKIGFKGIGDAIKANPLMFLISIIIPLLEKFKVFEILIGAIGKAFDWLTDAIGLTNRADEEATKKFLSNSKERLKVVSAEYDAKIKIAKAEGKDTYELEQAKLREVYNSNARQYNNLLELAKKKKGLNDEELKEFKDLQVQLLVSKSDLEASKAAHDKEAKDKEAARVKELNDKYRAAYDEQLKANQELQAKIKAQREKDLVDAEQTERAKALKTLEIQNQNQVEEVNKSKANKKLKNEELSLLEAEYRENVAKINAEYDKKDEQARLEKEAKIKAEQDKADAERLAAQQNANQQALAEEQAFNELQILNTQEGTAARLQAQIDLIESSLYKEVTLTNKTEEEKLLAKRKAEMAIDKLRDEYAKKDRERKFKDVQDSLQLAGTANKGLTDLSTVFFNTKLNNTKKGSEEEQKVLKQQFEANKAFQMANAIINGAMAVTSILASPSNKVDPTGTLMAVQIAAAIASTAAQISTIERTRFEGGTPSQETPSMGGGGASAPTATPSMPQTRTEQGTFLNEQGQTTGRIDTRVYVLESDITNTQRDVSRVKTQSKV